MTEENHGHILVVDDQPLLRSSTARCLTSMGYAVEASDDGVSVVERQHFDDFDLALVDLKMPRVDGFDVCAFLQARRPDLPIVVMSGYVTEEDRERLSALGVREVLSKPFDVSWLRATIARALAPRAD
jgi:CheY-like chemotaxis protein